MMKAHALKQKKTQPWWNGSCLAPARKKIIKKRQKVMKHSSRGSVKLNEESGPRANAGHKKRKKKIRRPLTPSTHRSAKSL